MFVLDTSVLRGLSRKDIISVCGRFEVAISTLTVLELASHLGDGEEIGYLRARGNLIKCKYPKILDDPFWALASDTSLIPNPTRGEDRLMLTQLIDAVEQAETLMDLGTKRIFYPDGQVTSCNDLGTRVSAILHDEEKHYVKGIESLSARACGRPLTPGSLFEEISYVVNKLASSQDFESKGSIFLAVAPYVGYMISRLNYYEGLRTSEGQALQIDLNDCEDAYIALHLDLSRNVTLVTNDKGTIKALSEVCKLLSELLSVDVGRGCFITGEEFLRYVASS